MTNEGFAGGFSAGQDIAIKENAYGQMMKGQQREEETRNAYADAMKNGGTPATIQAAGDKLGTQGNIEGQDRLTQVIMRMSDQQKKLASDKIERVGPFFQQGIDEWQPLFNKNSGDYDATLKQWRANLSKKYWALPDDVREEYPDPMKSSPELFSRNLGQTAGFKERLAKLGWGEKKAIAEINNTSREKIADKKIEAKGAGSAKDRANTIFKITTQIDKDIKLAFPDDPESQRAAKRALSADTEKMLDAGQDEATILAAHNNKLDTEASAILEDYESDKSTESGRKKGFFEKEQPIKRRKAFQTSMPAAKQVTQGSDDQIVQTGTAADGSRVGRTKSGKIVPLGR